MSRIVGDGWCLYYTHPITSINTSSYANLCHIANVSWPMSHGCLVLPGEVSCWLAWPCARRWWNDSSGGPCVKHVLKLVIRCAVDGLSKIWQVPWCLLHLLVHQGKREAGRPGNKKADVVQKWACLKRGKPIQFVDSSSCFRMISILKLQQIVLNFLVISFPMFRPSKYCIVGYSPILSPYFGQLI